MPENDGMTVNRHCDWKLGIVLVLAAALFATATLAVRSWARQTCLPPPAHPVASSTR